MKGHCLCTAHVRLVLLQDGTLAQIGRSAVHAEFLHDDGFAGCDASVVVVFHPLHAVGGAVVVAALGVGVHVDGAKVDVGQGDDVGKGLAGLAVVREVVVLCALAVVEVADAAEGDEVCGVEGSDVARDVGRPLCKDGGAAAVRGLAARLQCAANA